VCNFNARASILDSGKTEANQRLKTALAGEFPVGEC